MLLFLPPSSLLSSSLHPPLLRYPNAAKDASGAAVTGPLFQPAYEPFPRTEGQTDPNKLIGALALGFAIALWTTIALSYIPALLVFFVTMEKEKKIYHQQKVMGVSTLAYHLSNYIFDILAFLPSLVIITLVYATMAPEALKSNLVGVFLLLVLYIVAIPPFGYVLSRQFSKSTTAQSATTGINILVGIILLIAYFVLLLISLSNDSYKHYANLVGVIGSFLLPNFAVGSGLINLSFFFSDAFPFHPSLFDWQLGIGRSVALLLVDAAFYWLLLFFLERRDERVALTGFDGGLASHADDVSSATPPAGEDEAVHAERVRLASQGGRAGDNISIRGLRKVYPPRPGGRSADVVVAAPRGGFCQRACATKDSKVAGAHEAVKDFYLGIQPGECFGLLGVNGAGKTTTLSMLTGDVCPSSGSATLAGYDVSTELPKVLGQVGYCPQFDALLEELTGFELLRIFAAFKGVPENKVELVVSSLVQKVGLTAHASNPTKGYSGGNKRKLSLAMALVGSPTLVFLDEPSSGMDPFARREMWKVIQTTAQTLGSSVILTTHFMEEADALCSRIGIMVDGRLACLGSSQELKSAYGAGYQVELRISGSDEGSQMMLRDFIGTLSPVEAGSLPVAQEGGAEYIGNVKLLEYHGGQVRCELPSDCKLSLATVFAKIEDARDTLGIQDYAVSQTSLEQVFLRFAKGQQAASKTH
jgi:ABC-type multidrug transport system ATPase subunit